MTPAEIRQAVEWACILEATAQKPGNVHPRASFADLDYLDFVRAALASSDFLSNAREMGVGRAVLEVVKATKEATKSNVNLGIVLLLAPMCAAACWNPSALTLDELRTAVVTELAFTTIDDSKDVFEAIRQAKPGGLGSAPQQDVSTEPTIKLREVMKLAADRDAIARQYANGFADVFDVGVPSLAKSILGGLGWEDAVIRCHLAFMAAIPDTLIARKLGIEIAIESQHRAQFVLDQNCDAAAVCNLDSWLRADGNRRNPGTSADLTAAALFVANVTGLFPRQ